MAESREPLRVPIPTTTRIEQGQITSIHRASSYLKNLTVRKDGDRLYCTQRPGLRLTSDYSETGSKPAGRGTYAGKIVNYDTIYAGYGSAIGTITAGRFKVFMTESGAYTVFIDPAGNKGYTYTGSTFAQITDGQFPSALKGGVVDLDNTTYVTDGTYIYGSDLSDPTSWDALNIIAPSRESDSIVCIEKHHDHVVALKERSIEFLWNAGNPTGSPLSVRTDIYHNIGCANENSVTRNKDAIYFIGASAYGDVGIYKIVNFGIEKISDDEVDKFIYGIRNKYKEGPHESAVRLTSFSYGGVEFLILTAPVYGVTGYYSSNGICLVYDGISWAEWDSDLIPGLPIVSAVSYDTGTSSAKVYLQCANGDIFSIQDKTYDEDATDLTVRGIAGAGENPGDSQIQLDSTASATAGDNIYVSLDTGAVHESTIDTVDSGTLLTMVDALPSGASLLNVVEYSTAGITRNNIPIAVRFPHIDGGTNKYKFCNSLEIVGDHTEASQTITVKTSDGDHNSWTSGRTLDISSRRKLTRMGRFSRWNVELSGSPSERVHWEALELDVTVGHT